MGVYIELPKEWAKWSFDVRDMHDNILVAKVTDLDLVRCGECKWSYTDERDGLTWCKVHMSHYRVNADHFCSYGERRTDEGTTE